MRVFVAIPLPQQLRSRLAQFGAQLAAGQPSGVLRPVAADRIHLTLRFLGETPSRQIDLMAAELRPVAKRQAPFRLRAAGVGYFPNRRRANVAWVGLQGDLAPLAALKVDVDRALTAFGHAPERRKFQPHLTVARVKRRQQLSFDRLPAEGQAALAGAKGEFDVTHFALIRSELHPHGPVYTNLATFQLG